PEGSYQTVAGLVLDRLGHIPEPGDHVTVAGWRLEVTAMQRRVVTQLLVTRAESGPPDDQPTA
ncbi:MAG: hypothetical protein L7U56_04505, partial [Acidimicrobiales bacterium]|nr:hypothetical protein [Acidimicrobiales bacterium]